MIGRPGIIRLLLSVVAWISLGLTTALPAVAACQGESCRILVVGDMGIGDDAFTAGFLAVQQAMIQEAPDLVLYLGDYIYTKDVCTGNTPAGDMPPYIAEVRDKLVVPFQGNVVLSRGDNDAPEGDSDWAKAADTCWQMIASLGAPLAKPPGARDWEGVTEDLPGVLIAVLDHDALAADKLEALAWLEEPVKRAKDARKWVLVLIHEPVVTTAWFEKPCCATLKPLHDMGVDLVFSGHQHSFERTYPLGVTVPPNRIQPLPAAEHKLYQAGSIPSRKGGGICCNRWRRRVAAPVCRPAGIAIVKGCSPVYSACRGQERDHESLRPRRSGTQPRGGDHDTRLCTRRGAVETG